MQNKCLAAKPDLDSTPTAKWEGKLFPENTTNGSHLKVQLR